MLRYLAEIARLGSIRRASATLNIAPSAVDRQVLRIEHELGIRVFDRMPTGMRLTPAGELLLRHVRSTLQNFDRLLTEIDGLQGIHSGHVTLAAVDSLLVDFIPRALTDVARRYPAVTFTALAAPPAAVLSGIASGELEMGMTFVVAPGPALQLVSSAAAPLGCVMAPHHALAKRKSLSLQDLDEQSMMLQIESLPSATDPDDSFAAFRTRARTRFVSNSIEFQRQILRTGLGVACLTRLGFHREIAAGELVWLPLDEPALRTLEIGLFIPAHRTLSPAASQVVKTITVALQALAVAAVTASILIDSAFVCADAEARVGSVLVEKEKIASVAWSPDNRSALRSRAGEIVDGTGRWLLPGLIDGHAHAYSGLLRGTENSLPLELWALYTTVYGRAIDAQGLRLAILLGAAERIRAGITGTVDHSPMVHAGADAIAAHEASGLRVAFAAFLHDISDYDLFDIALPKDVAALVSGPPPLDAEAYSRMFADLVATARAGSGRVTVQLGPNAPQRCSPDAWALWRTLRDRHDVAVHTHLLETRAQASLNRKWPGGLVAEMAREGLLEGRLTCAHGVWLSAEEREVLARHDVTVSHNPASNLMLGSGVMDFQSCRACGLRLALGTDSANTGGRHDLFAVMRLAMMLPRPQLDDYTQWPDAARILSNATEGGAAALGLNRQLGRVSENMLADLILVRADAAGTLGTPSIATLVQHAGPEHVEAAMVDGRWVMRHGKIIAFDEPALLTEAAAYAGRLREQVSAQVMSLHTAMPGLASQLVRRCG